MLGRPRNSAARILTRFMAPPNRSRARLRLGRERLDCLRGLDRSPLNVGYDDACSPLNGPRSTTPACHSRIVFDPPLPQYKIARTSADELHVPEVVDVDHALGGAWSIDGFESDGRRIRSPRSSAACAWRRALSRG